MTVFTEIYNKDKDRIIFENKSFFSFLDQAPVNPGHALVIPKREIVDVFDLTEEEWMLLYPTLRSVYKRIFQLDLMIIYGEYLKNPISNKAKEFLQQCVEQLKKNDKISGFNVGVNNGRSAGRTVDHLHWHIIPRYDNDIEDPRGGVRYVIPERGNYK